MRVYEVILDGELATDLTDSPVPLQRHNIAGATILRFPMGPGDTLSRVLSLLESLGIGVTAVHQVGEDGPGHDPDG